MEKLIGRVYGGWRGNFSDATVSGDNSIDNSFPGDIPASADVKYRSKP